MTAQASTTHRFMRERDWLERVWGAWLTALEPWEFHCVLRHELEWHDRWASGEWSWDDLGAAIRREFEKVPT